MPRREWVKLIQHLEGQGCKCRRTKDGYFVLFPGDKGGTSIHFTHSDHRALRNMRSGIERAGLTWYTK